MYADNTHKEGKDTIFYLLSIFLDNKNIFILRLNK
jgi:hypothetical protein